MLTQEKLILPAMNKHKRWS